MLSGPLKGIFAVGFFKTWNNESNGVALMGEIFVVLAETWNEDVAAIAY